jgi:HK97 gp10 family phage protein
MAESIRLDGFKELEKTLEGLSGKTFAKGIVKSGLRRAAKPLIRSARNKVMGYSKTIGKSIMINYQSRDGATIAIGPKRKNGQIIAMDGDMAFIAGGRDPWFAHYVEFGVSGIGKFRKKRNAKGISGTRRYRADQPARPFMRPAFEETKEEMMQNFEKSIWESIEKYVAKHGANVT